MDKPYYLSNKIKPLNNDLITFLIFINKVIRFKYIQVNVSIDEFTLIFNVTKISF